VLRILIIDDSITQREILRKVLEADGEFTVVGEGRDGNQAVPLVTKHQPDVVLMDVHMPEMDGVEATRHIMRKCPVPVVIMSATLRKRDIDHGLAGLEAGAVSIVQKPKGAALLHLQKIGPDLRKAILTASHARITRRVTAVPTLSGGRDRAAAAAVAPLASKQESVPVEAVGICTSTGGPPVLVEILSALPSPFPLPILLVQHISQPFVDGFATWLSGKCRVSVQIAVDDQRLAPGVWLAPAGKHLTLGSRRRIALIPKSPTDVHCPSGNPLFSSLARHLGPRAVGVQLTGMGDDGARGLLELKLAGGHTLIQDEASSMIFGMPKVARELGAADHELCPGAIAELLIRMAGVEARRP
jgi:two-component system chemotaxis response regulator CheB